MLSEFFSTQIQWFQENEEIVFWLAGGSAVLFVISLLLIPWLIIRIPSDYFLEPGRYRSALFGDHPVAIIISKILRNTLAVCFIALGVFLLVLPGQGLLTIFLGIFIADFPGKHKLVNWLVKKEAVITSLNWLRSKAGKDPIILKN